MPSQADTAGDGAWPQSQAQSPSPPPSTDSALAIPMPPLQQAPSLKFAADGAAPKKDRYTPETGRVYHDDHFVAGKLISSVPVTTPEAALTPAESLRNGLQQLSPFSAESGAALLAGVQGTGAPPKPAPAAAPEPLTKTSTRLVDGNANYMRRSTAGLQPAAGTMMLPAPSMGTPMPKWPANYQSAAFEAVSVKKSYILSPAEIYAECAHHGEEKSKFSWYKTFMLSIVAGCYVGFGFTTCLLVGGLMNEAPSNPDKTKVNLGVFRALFGAFGFPFGFTTIVVCGGELYTSMCAYTAAAWWEGKIRATAVLRMLVLTWVGNFIGTSIMVGFFMATEHYEAGRGAYTVYLAEDKTHHSWGMTFAKAILANWLVGIATWMANAAQDLTGKFIGVWLPISSFAAIGAEHCIANMFAIPMAMSVGAHVDAKAFVWHNLIPATLGNWVGGGVMVATAYAMVYGRTPVMVANWAHKQLDNVRGTGGATGAKSSGKAH